MIIILGRSLIIVKNALILI